MNKNCLLGIVALLFVCCTMLGCGKDVPQPANQTTTIYGTVFNKVTHEPVNGAQIEYGYYKASNTLVNGHPMTTTRYRISSAISGYDGQFEMFFEEIQYDELDWNDGFYVYVKCDGFQDYYSSAVDGTGGTIRLDINLAPEISENESFKVTVNGIETDTLYIGDSSQTTFLVTNNGNVSIRITPSCSHAYDMDLYYAGYQTGWFGSTLEPNQGESITIWMSPSLNIGYIYLNSAQVSKTIVCIRR